MNINRERMSTPLTAVLSAFLIISALFLHSPSIGQTADAARQVTGTVVDGSSDPVSGATVSARGGRQTAITDANGKFSINVKPNTFLSASMMGFTTAEVNVGNRTDVTITMKSDAIDIEDVVVSVGYGKQKMTDVTGSIATVKMSDLAKAPVPSFDEALAGRIAGVQVSSFDGQPGSEMEIVIRGANSLTQSNAPLYIVDGFPMESFSSSAINMESIESITILKDASSTAIYGSRGANGVVIIETKQGKVGATTIDYKGSYGLQTAVKTMDMMSPYEYVSYATQRNEKYALRYLTDLDRTLDYYKGVKSNDMPGRLLQTAPMIDQNLSISGGTKATRYVLSGGYINQKGVVVNSGYERYQFRARFNQQISKKLSLSTNFSYASAIRTGQESIKDPQPNGGYIARAWAFAPVLFQDMSEYDQYSEDEFGNNHAIDPIESSRNEVSKKVGNTLIGNIQLDYKITPYLTLMLQGGYDRRSNTADAFYNTRTYKGFPNVQNADTGVNGSRSESTTSTWTNENTLTYNKTFAQKHSLNALAGMSIETKDSYSFGYTSVLIPEEKIGIAGLPLGQIKNPTSNPSANALLSFFGRVNYTYDSRYVLTASFRADGSSKFSPKNRWGYFPSGAIAWNMHKENFLKDVKLISNSKLRASFGATGNNRVGDFVRFAQVTRTNYLSLNNTTPESAAMINSISNPDLKWETTEQIDLGYDLGMFGSRIQLTVDLYRKTTKNMLLNADIPSTTGIRKSYKNIGSIRNDGLEITLSTVNIRTKDFTWNSDFNISFNRDKVLKLADGQENMLSSVTWWSYFNNTPLYYSYVGGPVASFYGVEWAGNYQYSDFNETAPGAYMLKPGIPDNGNNRSTIQPGDIKYVDQNGDGTVDDNDRVVIGRCTPIHTGGFNNNFIYKNLSLNVFIQWNYGNDIMNVNRIEYEGDFRTNRAINQFASYVDHWTPENQSSRNFRIGGAGPAGVYSSRTLEDGSFLRLKTLQLSYSLPKQWINKVRINTMSVYFAAQNLFTWTNYSGIDPEVSTRPSVLTPGYDYAAYTRNRTFTIGVKASF